MNRQQLHNSEEKGTRMGMCVNRGVRHYLNTVKPCFRHNWLPAVVYLYCSIGLILPITAALKGSVHPAEWLKGSWTWMLALMVTGGIAECLFYGAHLPFLREKENDADKLPLESATENPAPQQEAATGQEQKKHAIWYRQMLKDGWRVMKCALINLTLVFLPLLIPATAAYYFITSYDSTATESAIPNGEGGDVSFDTAPLDAIGILHQHSLSLGLLIGGVVIIWFLLIPVSHVSLRYLCLHKGNFIMSLRRHYGEAMRHYGFVFAINLLALLFILLLSVVVCLPMMILLGAIIQAFMGASQGDSILLPSYFLPLLAAVTALMSWAQLLLRTLYLFILNEMRF